MDCTLKNEELYYNEEVEVLLGKIKKHHIFHLNFL